MASTFEIGQKLVTYCKEGKNLEAIETLYSPDIVSIEPHGNDKMPARMEGLPAILGKSKWWLDNHTVHAGEAKGPFPHGDQFIVFFMYDITPKTGPMAGKRFTMNEAALYTVKDGMIARKNSFITWGDMVTKVTMPAQSEISARPQFRLPTSLPALDIDGASLHTAGQWEFTSAMVGFTR